MKSIPLISFHTIIDEDLACLKYAILDIGINPSFNLDSIKSKTFYNIVHDLYMRKYKNPLYYIKSDNANTELLDRVYKELLTKHFLASTCLSTVEKEYLITYVNLYILE